ncbi:uncharacterized protein V6R79_014902 [Siganus canaliculatus]
MAQPAHLLPSEVWNHVFSYLCVTDKLSVRATCKYFKNIVDHGSLWKDWSVALSFPKGSYNSQFWASLRRRKVTSVVVLSNKAKDWKQLARHLPALTAVAMSQSSTASFDCLKNFPNLERLTIGRAHSFLFDRSTLCNPQKLTHLSMCSAFFPKIAVDTFISAVAQFINLTSLVCHHSGIFGETIEMIHSLQSTLPKLRHLSLTVLWNPYNPTQNPRPSGGVHGRAHVSGLSSLELIDCANPPLPEDAMRFMQNLDTFSVFHRRLDQQMPERCSPASPLRTWLRDLPRLSTLVIVRGPPLNQYVSSIPATVTCLTLRVEHLNFDDMRAVAVQVPNLLHLHIDLWPSYLGALTGEIPQLFPKLRSLKLRHEHVPERDFLNLHQLRDLEDLEILDGHPLNLGPVVARLQTLTKHRLRVRSPSSQSDMFTCSCVHQFC